MVSGKEKNNEEQKFSLGWCPKNRDLNQADLHMKGVYFSGKVIKNTLLHVVKSNSRGNCDSFKL